MKVDVIQSYGDKPDPKEIQNSINTAEKDGYTLADTDCYGANYAEGDVNHVVILYFEEGAL